jgi:hypothetical protein
MNMTLKPGKLYKVTTKELPMCQEQHLGIWTSLTNLHTRSLKKNSIFLFIENCPKGKSDFSKILVDDKVFMTYNEFHLQQMIIEADENESIPSSSSSTND